MMGHNTLRNRAITLAGLLLFFALALGSALAKSPTADESAHILRGHTLWQTGDLRLQIKPPLSHWLIGSLLFLESDLPDVTRLEGWTEPSLTKLSTALLWQSGIDIERVFLLARLPIIYLGLVTGAIMVSWAREYLGQPGQNVALLLFALSPNLLASASLATTDFTAAATFFLALFAFWSYRRHPSWKRWLLVSISLGLALGAKITNVSLAPIFLLLIYLPRNRSQRWWRPAIIWLSFLPIAGLIVWALYLFDLGLIPGLPFPLPAATYASNFMTVQGYIESGRPAFLLGEQSDDGWWYYFIVALLIKTPIPALLLLSVAIIYLIKTNRWQASLPIWLPVIVLFIIASYSRLNIGYRHMLPILPPLLLLAATSVPLWQKRRYTRALLLILLAWVGISALRQHPHHLAYFNELVGGPSRGYRYLGDSNLDWGQDLNLLAEFVSQEREKPVFYSYFGAADPAYYGLEQSLLFSENGEPVNFSPANPTAGIYAISANHIQGMVLPNPDLFAWFRQQQPIGNLGYSILIYDVPETAAGDWVAHCLNPAPAIDDQAYVSLLVNQQELRHVYFDCHTSWVFPNDAQPGWYILPPGEQWLPDRYFPENFKSVYADTSSRHRTPHEVFYWDGKAKLAEWLMSVNQQAALPGGIDIDLPALIGDEVRLEGHLVDQAQWLTLWKVQGATDDPLTIAAHLYTGEQSSPIVLDGLGYTSIQWRPGDIFLQIYDLDLATPPVYMETGVYNYLSGEPRYHSADHRASTFVRLPIPVD